MNALKDAGRQLRAALRLAVKMQGRWEPEHTELLADDVQGCRDAAEAAERSLRGDSSLAEALLTVQEAQRQIEHEQLQQAIRGAARRHGWRAQ